MDPTPEANHVASLERGSTLHVSQACFSLLASLSKVYIALRTLLFRKVSRRFYWYYGGTRDGTLLKTCPPPPPRCGAHRTADFSDRGEMFERLYLRRVTQCHVEMEANTIYCWSLVVYFCVRYSFHHRFDSAMMNRF